MTNRASEDVFRIGEAYSVAEAARLAKTTPATVRNWLLGYDRPGHHMKPVFGGKETELGKSLRVSFLELVEIAVAAEFRALGIKLDRIRRAHEFARKKLYVPFPFATLNFKTLGGHVIHEFEVEEPVPYSGHMAFDHEGQWTLPGDVQKQLDAVDFDSDDLAERWYPFGRDIGVVIDPHQAAGRPVIKGTRVPVSAIQQRFDAGDSVEFLAQDYDLPASVVEEILRLAKVA